MASMDELAGRLERATAAFSELGTAIAAREPWPPADVYGPGPESAWGPHEVLAHVAEMLPFWMGEIELIIDAGVGAADEGGAGADAGSGGGEGASEGASGAPSASAGAAEPPAFGRLEDDPLRVQIIGRDRAFPSRELLGRISVEGRRVAQRFRELDERRAAMLGRHVTRGDLEVREIAEVLIVKHVEGHVAQLQEILAVDR
jgi:hypothetical protein